MTPANLSAEEEFQKLYGYLSTEVPKLFLINPNYADAFGVGEEFDDDEFLASFVMPFDAYQPAIGLHISMFLQGLRYPWTVCGSFDLHKPFMPSGKLSPAPRFWVSRSGVTGEVDPIALITTYGANLRKADGSPA
jgi:hypothetical protein